MALETGNYISALVRTNPLSSDNISEGDDHLQLIKKILQKTFPKGYEKFPIEEIPASTDIKKIVFDSWNSRILINLTKNFFI